MKQCIGLMMGAALILSALQGCARKSAADSELPHYEWFIVVADGMPELQRKQVLGEIEELITRRANPGDCIQLVAAPEHRLLVSFQVPEGSASARLRKPVMKDAIIELRRFASGGETGGSMQLSLPNLAASVRSLRRTEFPLRVVLVGSPIYREATQAGWSWENGVVPTDGAIGASSSPFRKLPSLPSDTEVSWIVPTVDWGTDELHRQAAIRFIRLLLQEQGAGLVRLTPDAELGFAFQEGQFAGQIAKRNGVAEMRQVSFTTARSEEVPIKTLNVDVTESRAGEIDPVASENASGAEGSPQSDAEAFLSQALLDPNKIGIAINWDSADQSSDVDLWISDDRYSGELSFQERNKEFGMLHRDVTSVGSLDAAAEEFKSWEWAEINHSELDRLGLWLDVYRTNHPVTVRVICVWQGERFENVFTIDTHRGDGASEHPNRSTSNAWLKVDLGQLE